MAKVETFEDLKCWQKAKELVNMIFNLSSDGKLGKDFDTKSQLRKTSLSVMNNIAEGFSRYYKKEFIRFLDISQISAAEVKSMSYILQDLNYLDQIQIRELRAKADEVRYSVLALIKYLDRRKQV